MSINLRLAQPEDSKFIYDLRFSDDVAKQSLQMSKPTFEQHNEWFLGSISDPNRHLYIITKNADKAGMIRLDINTSTELAEVSLAVHLDYRSQGIAATALSEVEKLHPNVKNFLAKVKPENEASLKLFTSLEYKQEYIILSKHRPS